jgi:glycosidase
LFWCSCAHCAAASDFRQETIYQIVTDRFFDGDHANNDSLQSKGMFDAGHTNWQCYWGGDFSGIVKKLTYLRDLGVTALWISPPVDNCNIAIADDKGNPTSPYHGYHARDFMQIEEHFGDKRNSWKAFDRLIKCAHQLHMKVIVDFACNHSSKRAAGECGNIYRQGELLAAGTDDRWFHHNGEITDYNDRYQIQYQDIFNLADLAQENAVVDEYLKKAMANFLVHKVDAFRLDAVKHVNWGWQYSLLDALNSKGNPFVFGEWFDGSIKSPMWPSACNFANDSGMALFDYPLAMAMRDVFANDKEFQTIDETIYYGDQRLKNPSQQVTFFDNHDIPRLLNLNQSKDRLHQALAFLLTCRGTPCITYGTEQYLFNSTNSGADPYDRPMMESFAKDTTAFAVIKELAKLRKENLAVAYGSFKRRFVNTDVYVFEREFEGNVVTVAINKSAKSVLNLPVCGTSLPAGNYNDYLHGLLNGLSMQVKNEPYHEVEHSLAAQKLPPSSVSVWVSGKRLVNPTILNISPPQVHAKSIVEIEGKNFGVQSGLVLVGTEHAPIVSWAEERILAQIPAVKEGELSISVQRSDKKDSNSQTIVAHSGSLIPVTVYLQDLPESAKGEDVFIGGDTIELKAQQGSIQGAGPMLVHGNARLFTVSLPANKTVHLKFIKTQAKKSNENEPGLEHSFVVPNSGVGNITFTWNRAGSGTK